MEKYVGRCTAGLARDAGHVSANVHGCDPARPRRAPLVRSQSLKHDGGKLGFSDRRGPRVAIEASHTADRRVHHPISALSTSNILYSFPRDEPVLLEVDIESGTASPTFTRRCETRRDEGPTTEGDERPSKKWSFGRERRLPVWPIPL